MGNDQPKTNSSTLSATLPELHVLVAEDNPINQKIVSKILEKLGHKVTLANSGSAVLSLLGQSSVDIILMDCHMPDMNGIEATQRIRQLEQAGQITKYTPIIAFTGDELESDAEHCIRHGMDDFLGKPATLDKFRTVLSRVYSRLIAKHSDT